MKEIRASAIQAGNTVVFKKARNTVSELVGKRVVQSCSKAKGERTVSIETDRGFFTIPWDRRVLLVDTKEEYIPPTADNHLQMRATPVEPMELKPIRTRIPSPWAGLPPPPPVRTPDEPKVTSGYLDQQDRDRLLIEVLKLVASFVNSATGLIKKAAGLV